MRERDKIQDSDRKIALADAAAGVIGSLVSMLAFYPVDLWKTKIQAGTNTTPIEHNDYSTKEKRDSNYISDDEISRYSRNKLSFHQSIGYADAGSLPSLFRGLPHKVVHTIVSSFTYFYMYSLVQTKYAAYRKGFMRKHQIKGRDKIENAHGASTITKLLLTAIAAMINTCITLPLDTISSRKQAENISERNSLPTSNNKELNGVTPGDENGKVMMKTSMSAEREGEEAMGGVDRGNPEDNACKRRKNPHNMQQLYIKTPEKYKFSFSTNLPHEAFSFSSTTKEESDNYNNLEKKIRSITSLWNGLLPAILLCTNPAIQYTMYDTLKNVLLQHRWSEAGKFTDEETHQHQYQSSKLSMWEAFVFGLISKFFATVTTYPLIRAKVLLMVSPPDTFEDDTHESSTNKRNTDKVQNGRKQTQQIPAQVGKHPRSLPLLLLYIFRKDGFRGIYQGCSLQLFHTILKSALLMMVREKITFMSRQFFEVDDSS